MTRKWQTCEKALFRRFERGFRNKRYNLSTWMYKTLWRGIFCRVGASVRDVTPHIVKMGFSGVFSVCPEGIKKPPFSGRFWVSCYLLFLGSVNNSHRTENTTRSGTDTTQIPRARSKAITDSHPLLLRLQLSKLRGLEQSTKGTYRELSLSLSAPPFEMMLK